MAKEERFLYLKGNFDVTKDKIKNVVTSMKNSHSYDSVSYTVI